MRHLFNLISHNIIPVLIFTCITVIIITLIKTINTNILAKKETELKILEEKRAILELELKKQNNQITLLEAENKKYDNLINNS